jgi:hypothetical protein
MDGHIDFGGALGKAFAHCGLERDGDDRMGRERRVRYEHRRPIHALTDAAPTARRDRKCGRHARPRFPILIAALFLVTCSARDAARVGEIRIAETDLSQRARVSEVQFPGSGKTYIALAQLVKGYLALAVLQSLNVPTGEAAIEAEARRIDANTKSPEVLKRIKDVYGSDRRGYLATYVRIVYAERSLYNEVFLKDPAIHAAQRKKAEEFLAAAVKKPSAFGTIALEMGLAPVTMTLSREKGVRRADVKERGTPGGSPETGGVEVEQAARMISALSGVKPGELAPTALEWQEDFQVIGLVRKEGAAYRIESVSVRKRNFDDWFWEKASKIPVRIDDKALKEAFLQEVSWAKHTAMEP